MCGKGNNGFEKEKFVLLSKKRERKWIEKKREWKRRKERSIKKVAIRLGVQIINIEMSLGNFMLLEREFCERVTMMKCFHLSQDIWTPLSHSFN